MNSEAFFTRVSFTFFISLALSDGDILAEMMTLGGTGRCETGSRLRLRFVGICRIMYTPGEMECQGKSQRELQRELQRLTDQCVQASPYLGAYTILRKRFYLDGSKP